MKQPTKEAFNAFLKCLLAENAIEAAIKLIKTYPTETDVTNTDVMFQKVLRDPKPASMRSLVSLGIPISPQTHTKIFKKALDEKWVGIAMIMVSLNPTKKDITTLFSFITKNSPQMAIDLCEKYGDQISKAAKLNLGKILIKRKIFIPAWEFAKYQNRPQDFPKIIKLACESYTTGYHNYNTQMSIIERLCENAEGVDLKLAYPLISWLVEWHLNRSQQHEALDWANKRKRPGFTKTEKQRYRI